MPKQTTRLALSLAKYRERRDPCVYLNFTDEAVRHLYAYSVRWQPVLKSFDDTFLLEPVREGGVKLERSGQLELGQDAFPVLFDFVPGYEFGASKTEAVLWSYGSLWVTIPKVRRPVRR